jgi:hypothetical protein
VIRQRVGAVPEGAGAGRRKLVNLLH